MSAYKYSTPSEELQDYDDYDPNDVPPDQASPVTGTQFISSVNV